MLKALVPVQRSENLTPRGDHFISLGAGPGTNGRPHLQCAVPVDAWEVKRCDRRKRSPPCSARRARMCCKAASCGWTRPGSLHRRSPDRRSRRDHRTLCPRDWRRQDHHGQPRNDTACQSGARLHRDEGHPSHRRSGHAGEIALCGFAWAPPSSAAVIAARMPNIAIGDAPRSCAFTLLQVAMLAFVHRSESIYTKRGARQHLVGRIRRFTHRTGQAPRKSSVLSGLERIGNPSGGSTLVELPPSGGCRRRAEELCQAFCCSNSMMCWSTARLSPGFASSALTVASISARSTFSIFIASMTASFSPALTS